MAQGYEAGGHTGEIASMVLTPDIVDAVGPDVPVLGAGGIGSGRQVAASLSLGAQGVFINVARGSVVDQDALIAALQQGTILAAGLDVYEDEPNVPVSLRALPNTVLLPHIGSASQRTREAMGGLVVDNLRAWFETGRALTPVAETPNPG